MPLVSIAGPRPKKWRLTFEDDFIGSANAAPDSAKWKNPDTDNDYPKQSAKLLSTNAYLDGSSNLVIRAVEESSGGASYTSGNISTFGKFSQAYGRFECRAQMPAGGGGIWPAPLWAVGPNWATDGEIDAVEMWTGVMDTAQMYFHWDSGGHQSSGATYVDSGLATGFHIYAVEWEPGKIVWFIDGAVRRTLIGSEVTGTAMCLNIDMYIGGPAGSAAGTTFPQYMYVDYVRAYERAA